VVAVGLPGIGGGKAGDGLVHAVALAEVSGDGCGVARLGVCEREGPPQSLQYSGKVFLRVVVGSIATPPFMSRSWRM